MIRFDIEVPHISRTRLLVTLSLTSTASGLWIAAPIYLPHLPLIPDADLTAWMVFWGIVLPLAVGITTLLFAEWRIVRDRADRERRRAEREATRDGERATVIAVVPR